ncbi:TonB-dependent receptor plug domain-containing protein [Hyphomicrobium sp.]|uniref:TonB-dependent receptor plug domain-containing protein n=1 Tax=Hyphomicrobium sp. TaxID=82 RepID=UPI002D78A877|nr:TonB-dependent receptor [Hyphomicrobium sp.]HET6387822.1 TonB-dependent receptor [Hyphomicrobium sp.]
MLRDYKRRTLRATLFCTLSSFAAIDANAQQPISAELPEVTVASEPEAKPRKKKAPAAAQQSSTPQNSDGGASGTARGADHSDIAVSPTGIASPVEQIASSVTVITSKEIEAQQRRTLPDVLKSVPGLNIVQMGGPGGQTSIFMRGTNSNHTKVFIDGIDVSDPSSANRSFNLGQMLTTDIERVEVLRGPQSGLYGADAVGGVISVYTKTGKGPPKVTGMVEGGSFGTFNQAARISGGADRYNYSFSVSHFRADDTPVTPFDLLLPGEARHSNRYDNWTYSTKIGVDVTKDVTVNFVSRYTDARLYYTGDDFNFPSHPNPFLTRSDFDQFYTRGEAVWKTFGGQLTHTFGINYANLQTDNYDIIAGSNFADGERVKFDWRSVWRIAPGYTLLTGAEQQTEELDSDGLLVDEWNRAAFAELQSEIFRNFFLVANVRYDDNENFGGHTTWRVAPAYVIEATGTKLKASAGTAFKAPTLNQRFQDFPPYYFGNRDLKPEESLGLDAGFEQAVFGGQAQFGATYFYNDITNLIVTNADFTTNINVGKAKTSGVEVFASADITESLRIRADYTYTEATDEDTHTQLLRRPRHKASLSAGWTATDRLLLTPSLVYVGEAEDVDRSDYEEVTLPGFLLVNVAADYKLREGVSLFGRIDNLFDKHYENPNGFEGTGIGAYAGLRFTN